MTTLHDEAGGKSGSALRDRTSLIARARLTDYEAHREIAGLRKQRGGWFVVGMICGVLCGGGAAVVILARLA